MIYDVRNWSYIIYKFIKCAILALDKPLSDILCYLFTQGGGDK